MNSRADKAPTLAACAVIFLLGSWNGCAGQSGTDEQYVVEAIYLDAKMERHHHGYQLRSFPDLASCNAFLEANKEDAPAAGKDAQYQSAWRFLQFIGERYGFSDLKVQCAARGGVDL